MRYTCRKVSVKSSAAQWSVDVLVADDGDFPFAGSMLSVTREFPRDMREGFINDVKRLISPSVGLA